MVPIQKLVLESVSSTRQTWFTLIHVQVILSIKDFDLDDECYGLISRVVYVSRTFRLTKTIADGK